MSEIIEVFWKAIISGCVIYLLIVRLNESLREK